MKETPQQVAGDQADKTASGQFNRILKRFGGRHLIFRTKTGGWWLLPKPYVLISSFRGPIWVFYGAGQIWATHKKLRDIGGWMARVPRFVNKNITRILDKLDPDLTQFVTFCNEHGIEGTIVVERRLIEFHWTFGDELDQETHKQEHSDALDANFKNLCDSYLKVKEKLNL